jgi:hypothetical protein
MIQPPHPPIYPKFFEFATALERDHIYNEMGKYAKLSGVSAVRG